jgi:hypothetical protein
MITCLITHLADFGRLLLAGNTAFRRFEEEQIRHAAGAKAANAVKGPAGKPGVLRILLSLLLIDVFPFLVFSISFCFEFGLPFLICVYAVYPCPVPLYTVSTELYNLNIPCLTHGFTEQGKSRLVFKPGGSASTGLGSKPQVHITSIWLPICKYVFVSFWVVGS